MSEPDYPAMAGQYQAENGYHVLKDSSRGDRVPRELNGLRERIHVLETAIREALWHVEQVPDCSKAETILSAALKLDSP